MKPKNRLHRPILALIFAILFCIPAYCQDSADEYYLEGVERGAEGDFEGARTGFENALRIDPFLFYASSAKKIADDAINHKIPGQSAVNIFKGIHYCNKERWDEALNEVGDAIGRNPEYADAYNERGIIYDMKDEHDKAIADFTKVIEIDPSNEHAYNNRGYVYGAINLNDKAIEDFTKALEINPYYAIAYYNRGWILAARKGVYDDAVRDFTKAIEINQYFDNAYVDRGLSYFYRNRFDDAISDFSRAIEINPKNTRAHWNRAVCFEKTGKVQEAIASYKGVLQNAPLDSSYAEDAKKKIVEMER